MKKIISFCTILSTIAIFGQETANRFFYEVTFKPKKGVEVTDKVITTLDITKEKSIYRDFTIASQDSILKVEVETMQKIKISLYHTLITDNG